MNVQVGDRLPRCQAVIDPDIVGGRGIFTMQRRLRTIQKPHQADPLLIGDREERIDVSPRNDQCVARRNGEVVANYERETIRVDDP